MDQSEHIDPGAGWLVGGGEMGKVVRAKDWSSTPLGPISSWPNGLRTTINLALASNFPISIAWGPGRVQIYNDGYWPICGAKHPHSMGQDFKACWFSAWPAIGEAFETASGGTTAFLENQRMFLDRNGYLEETFFTFSFSPIRDETGKVAGLFHPVTELTLQSIAERRLGVLRDVSDATADARTVDDAAELVVRTLVKHPLDVPFALFYLLDREGRGARLAGATGIEAGAPAAPRELDAAATAWPFARILRADEPLRLDGLGARLAGAGPYPEPPDVAMALPIRAAGLPQPLALLIAGASSRRPFDGAYRTFFAMLQETVTNALVNARTYEEERKRAEALAELDRAKTRFFSNVSHEFRTPLTLMLGPLEDLLQREAGLQPAGRERIEVVQRNSLRLLKLVNTMLDFSRIEAGRIVASYEPVDLAAYTAELASNFRSACEHAGLRLAVDCPPLPEPAYVDRDMWEKIVLNLLSNAFKFTLAGEIEVRLAAEDGRAVLSVRDTGVGIPEDELGRVFERFHRVENARGRTHEGTGIGLALVLELARLHGGTAHAESVLGEGSRLVVAIPLGKAHLDPARIGARSPLAPTRTAADAFVQEALRWLPGRASDGIEAPAGDLGVPPPADEGGPRARVLWADDNADMRDYVAELLGEAFDVEAVADGEAALDAARARPPDLVLSDVMMPRLDGFGLLRALRAEPELREIPVILLSARAGEEARIEGVEAGADDYLIKPFGARELLARVGAHVRLARLRRAAVERVRENEARLASQKKALELTVAGAPLGDVLDVVADAARRHAGAGARACLFLYAADDRGLHLAATAGPDAPHEDAGLAGLAEAALDARAPGCEAAAGPEAGLVVRDLASEPFPELATALAGVRTSWSVSIHSAGGRPLGALAVYLHDARQPDEQTTSFLELLARTTALIVERHEQLERLAHREEALREADRRKDEFLATLSHELRNPLAPLRNCLETMRLARDPSAVASAREIMERQLAQLVRLVDDLLDLSRISRGKVTLRKEVVPLAALLARAVETSRPLLERAGLELAFDEPPADLHVEADPARVTQVFSNLLNNAAKFTPRDGHVRLSWSRADGDVLVAVRDDGAGIRPAMLARIFDMFTQEETAPDRPPEGLGIGLWLVRNLVEMHGGSVTARSEGPGKGSEFVVRLPTAGAPAAADAGAGAPERELPSRRILVVDDNRDAASTMAMMLGILGHETREAHDGHEALAVAAEFRPEVILLDLGMPRMNGIEAAQRIRREPWGKGALLVALTGMGREEDRRRSAEAGFDRHLVKPVDIAALQELLAELAATRA